MVSPELSRTMAYTTRNTVNRLAREQLHLNHVVSERTKGGINLYIEIEKHKFISKCTNVTNRRSRVG